MRRAVVFSQKATKALKKAEGGGRKPEGGKRRAEFLQKDAKGAKEQAVWRGRGGGISWRWV